MILREIILDLPDSQDEIKRAKRINEIVQSGNLSYDEAKSIYVKEWQHKGFEFRNMTRCMTSMIERFLPRLKTKDCRKINICCVNGNDKIIHGHLVNLLGVLNVVVQFDYNKFFEMTPYEKKKQTIEIVEQAILPLSDVLEIDTSEITKACMKVKEQNYINEWLYKKPTKSKFGYVQIKIQHDISEVNLYIVLYDLKKNYLKEIKILTTLPDEFMYVKYLGKVQWIEPDKVVLLLDGGSTVLSFNIPD